MSRNENDDVSHLNLPTPNKVESTYHMENGSILDDEKLAKLIRDIKKDYKKLPIICAKKTYNKSTDTNTFFVLCSGSYLFDPKNKDSRYRIRNRWKMKRVNKSIYDLYIRFLRTYYKSFLYQAERSM